MELKEGKVRSNSQATLLWGEANESRGNGKRDEATGWRKTAVGRQHGRHLRNRINFMLNDENHETKTIHEDSEGIKAGEKAKRTAADMTVTATCE